MRVSPYTRERLAKAAETSRTLSEALEKLGVDPGSPSRRYLRARMKAMGVETSHFEREGTRWSRETLEAAVTASSNWRQVLRHLGLPVTGGQQTHIGRRVRALGIDTAHFSGPYATGQAAGARRSRARGQTLLTNDPTRDVRVPGARLRQAMLELGVREECARCGTAPWWRGRPLPLETDHIDGDWRNNEPGNLRLLCPNCHSATDTYRGRGKRGRPIRTPGRPR
ncbi:HNH endonuclease signature motif containing protein [Streptomyces sp. NPDC003077]|uniref:HNH endonuclease signature motif containing protein n=1 Tax=Streptomyces sp. NPDC003077 TaxID=3154443 RepID=UPI0033A3CF0B